MDNYNKILDKFIWHLKCKVAEQYIEKGEYDKAVNEFPKREQEKVRQYINEYYKQ